MRAVFIELPHFAKERAKYLTDDLFSLLELCLIAEPTKGDIVSGTGGLRKLRFADARRGKGKRGGLRIIYFWWERGNQFWLFTVYDKDETDDLTLSECDLMRTILKHELEIRR